MKVMKFGGSSVADAERIARVAEIVADTAEASPDGGPVVVLSALKGTTDELIAAADLARSGNRDYRVRIDALEKRHQDTANALLDASDRHHQVLHERFEEMRGILHGVELVRECTDRTRDLVMSFGERLSCELFTAILRSRHVPVTLYDPRHFIRTDGTHGSARVNRPVSYEQIRKQVDVAAGVCVVPGFIAATSSGVTTTLGRNGSDYSASILGAGLGADCVEIWTDVDGVLSADPRYVEEAFVIDRMSFEEAAELSYFGAEVLHPSTMVPVVELGIPVVIRNTMNSEAPGTRISSQSATVELITGLASVENVSLVNVEGSGMVGAPGIAARIFAAIARAGANVLMISQASSEHTICLLFRSEDLVRAIGELDREFAPELASKEINPFDVQDDMAVVAVIGDGMRGRFGVSGRLFEALGSAGISVHAIAQGSSERNISFVVSGADRERTLQTVHNAFFSPGRK